MLEGPWPGGGTGGSTGLSVCQPGPDSPVLLRQDLDLGSWAHRGSCITKGPPPSCSKGCGVPHRLTAPLAGAGRPSQWEQDPQGGPPVLPACVAVLPSGGGARPRREIVLPGKVCSKPQQLDSEFRVQRQTVFIFFFKSTSGWKHTV